MRTLQLGGLGTGTGMYACQTLFVYQKPEETPPPPPLGLVMSQHGEACRDMMDDDLHTSESSTPPLSVPECRGATNKQQVTKHGQSEAVS